MTPRRVLLVEDDRDLRDTLALALRQFGLEVIEAGSGLEGIQRFNEEEFDVVVTDLKMPGMSGLELCLRVRENRPDVPVIVLTSFGSLDTAVAAIRAGAFDFVSKPIESEMLKIAIDRAIAHRALAKEVRWLSKRLAESERYGEMLGRSAPMREFYRQLDAAANSEAPVLLLGESGTGKEMAARALHQRGRRPSGPFCAVNCAALPGALLESELFGHVKGAFTDASRDRRGLVFEANGGTLFLDEIGDCPLEMQAKLLRALEERRARPVGGDRELPFDVRLVSATHRDLEAAIDDGRFRQDLFFRLCVIPIRIPALRERGDDVLLLARAFLDLFAARAGKQTMSFTESVAARLLDYDWPGNVRELRNAIERAVALARSDRIGVDDLPERIRDWKRERIEVAPTDVRELVSMDEIERRYITAVLTALEGNKSAAAKVLGFDRKTLYRKLARYGLDVG